MGAHGLIEEYRKYRGGNNFLVIKWQFHSQTVKEIDYTDRRKCGTTKKFGEL